MNSEILCPSKAVGYPGSLFFIIDDYQSNCMIWDESISINPIQEGGDEIE